MIRAVLFDADGVLQYPRPGWLAEMAALGDGGDFLRQLFVEEHKAQTGKADLIEVLTAWLRSRGLDVPAQKLVDIWCKIDLDEHMLPLVRRVREAGAITALTTNQQPVRGRWMQANMPYRDYFDQTFYSFEVGLAKPDPAYFTTVLESLDVAPHEAVFIDDLGTNVLGAREVGINGVIFAATDTYGSLRCQLRELGVPGI